MNSFHFLRPQWFLTLLPLLLLLFWLARRQLRSRSWQAVCDPQLLPHLLLGRSVRRANWPLWLGLVGLLLAVLALAGPAWKRQPQPLFRQQSALVILFDLSRSMQVADLKPSRLLRARLKIEDLLRQRQEGQTALIVFAADAFTVTPLTEDRHTIEALLKSLDPGMMPVQGSDPARAIELGLDLLHQAGLKNGRLLLVTDEDRPGLALDAARQLAQQGFELAVLGVGSSEGAPIPLPGGGFFKDAQGKLVLPGVDHPGLQELANAGGGNYRNISIDDNDLRDLLAGLDDRRLDQSDRVDQTPGASGDRWREEGVWLLWPLLLLAAPAFRRGWLLVLTLLLLVPPSAEALRWDELWSTPDQQASQTFERQDYSVAAEKFHDPRWKAGALYRAGKFDAAAEQLEKLPTADDLYNRGNALAKMGDLPAALKSYRQALKIDPEHADAKFNKRLVVKAMQYQGPKKKKQGDKGKQGPQQEQSDKGGKQSQNKPSSSAQKKQNKKEGEKQSQQEKAAGGEDKPQQEKPSEPSADEDNAPQPEDVAQKKKAGKDTAEQSGKASVASELPEKTPESAEQRETRLLLQQIPDDPGGLLRRKFLYQYRQRGQQRESDRSW